MTEWWMEQFYLEGVIFVGEVAVCVTVHRVNAYWGGGYPFYLMIM